MNIISLISVIGVAVAMPVIEERGLAVFGNMQMPVVFNGVPADHDPQTLALRRFNDMVAADPRVDKVILPLRDGMTIIRVTRPSPKDFPNPTDN